MQVIKHLENKCKYIEYVLVDEDEKEFVEQFKSLIISVKFKNKWWGTKSSGRSKIYKLKASKEVFKYLSQFETFCKYTFSDKGDIAEDTNFGINDIAFLMIKRYHYYLQLHTKVILQLEMIYLDKLHVAIKIILKLYRFF